jgi:tetratricopeptide (TPR) repeat protein
VLNLVDQKKYNEAELLLELLQQYPEYTQDSSFLMAGVVYESRRDMERALRELGKVTAESRFFERAQRFKVEILIESKRTDDALDILRTGQRDFPANRAYWEMEFFVLSKDKRYDDALAVLDRADVKWPDDSELAYSRGMTLDMAGRKGEAMRVMENLLDREPDNFNALNYIGYTLADENRELDRAITLLKKAISLSPDSTHIIDSVAWAHYRRNELDEAWKAITRAVNTNGYIDPTIWEHYGDIAVAADKREEARKGYEKALELNPANSQDIQRRLNALKNSASSEKEN